LVFAKEKIHQYLSRSGDFPQAMFVCGARQRQIQQLQRAFERSHAIIDIILFSPFQGSLDLTADMAQLSDQRQLIPAASPRCW